MALSVWSKKAQGNGSLGLKVCVSQALFREPENTIEINALIGNVCVSLYYV